TEAEEKLLGTEPDHTLAEKFGRTVGAVTERRGKLGIHNKWRQERLWTAEEDKLLGTMPDKDLATKLGRTVIAVKMRRSLQGIPPATGTGMPPDFFKQEENEQSRQQTGTKI